MKEKRLKKVIEDGILRSRAKTEAELRTVWDYWAVTADMFINKYLVSKKKLLYKLWDEFCKIRD
jgi:hypothetical protein